ncbi:hypothetical protein BpHYR1_027979 [Brachionus plicatilis]|uniref:Uncharacterized protein n=1 Tax=Brachionus plicatilis TaxID=10195 RepID=A0A3M7RKZ0_BRAPC|nr:hypothetical protein BpHYR1_027979 [Brachionus plicatilis]
MNSFYFFSVSVLHSQQIPPQTSASGTSALAITRNIDVPLCFCSPHRQLYKKVINVTIHV